MKLGFLSDQCALRKRVSAKDHLLEKDTSFHCAIASQQDQQIVESSLIKL